ncbi:response regulator [Crocinitomicaceae bacterium]|nr:response regulator [Crocinitomicaceae bacterium]
MSEILILHNQTLTESVINDLENDALVSAQVFDILPSEFSVPNFNLDQSVHKKLSQIFESSKKFDAIFLPYNLSKENYLEFTGILVALHIRLTPDFGNMIVPIVFYGPEDPRHVGKLSDFGTFLMSPKVLCTSKISAKKFLATAKMLDDLNEHDYGLFLNKINLEPKNSKYSSHHSVANEYALYHWSKEIGIMDEIRHVRDNLTYRLYFKFLDRMRHQIRDNSPPDSTIVDEKDYIESESLNLESTKILLIDDEAENGWGIFYKRLFEINNIISSEENFKFLRPKDNIALNSLKQDEIVELALNEIEEFDPDVVLLDLRLDRIVDFNMNTPPENLTGIRIAKKISQRNKGTQVIITSASNKIPNYLAASKKGLGVDGYVIKSINEDSSVKVSQIVSSLHRVIPRAKFFKAVATKISILNDKIKEFDSDFFDGHQIFLDRAFRLLYQNDINFSYLQLFHLIESYSKSEKVVNNKGNEYHIFTLNNKIVFAAKKVKNSLISNIAYTRREGYIPASYGFGDGKDATGGGGYIPVRLIMKLILVYRLSSFDKIFLLDTINALRNEKCGHSPKSSEDIIKEQEYLQILDFLLFIFDNANISDLRSPHAFNPKTWKDPDNFKNQKKKKQPKRW